MHRLIATVGALCVLLLTLAYVRNFEQTPRRSSDDSGNHGGFPGSSVTEPAGPSVVHHNGAPFVLVRDGEATATLVIQPAPGDGELDSNDQAAAEMIQEWIELMSGARLPIAREVPSGLAILIGHAATQAGMLIDDLDSPSREAVRIEVRDHRILMSGQSGVSRIKVAALFLEQLGCGWYIDGELGREYPRTETVEIGNMTITDQPGLLYRRIWGAEGWVRMNPWKAWNGAGGIELSMKHDWDLFTEEDFSEHPEWFLLDEESRRVYGPWLNTGNPELREVFTDRFIERMQPGEHPSLSPPDNHRTDHSPASKRFDDPSLIEKSSGHVSMTNRFMDFANHVARRAREIYPNAILGFYAYSDYSEPPTVTDDLEPNLCIWVAPIRFSRFHHIGSLNSPSRQDLARIIDGWAEVASRIGYRTYNFNLAEAMTPYSKIATWSHDIPYLAKRGCIGINIETFPTWDLSAPHIYLSVRLAYHPFADSDVVLDDFFTGFYGPAAELMREYWLTIDDAWQGLKTESGSIYSLHLVWTDKRLELLDGLLKRAEAAVAGDPTKEKRVAMTRIGWEHANDFRAVRDTFHAGDVASAKAAYDRWRQRMRASIESGTGHVYSERYLRRFVGRHLEAAYAALFPTGQEPNELVMVLPDEMRLAYEEELPVSGTWSPYAPSLDHSSWLRVKTHSATLDQQGYPDRLEVMWYRLRVDVEPRDGRHYTLLFTRVDGDTSAWLNGQPLESTSAARGVMPPAVTDQAQPRAQVFPALRSFEVDVSDHLQLGVNTLAVRVEHTRLRELKLGEIVGPVFLLSKPASE